MCTFASRAATMPTRKQDTTEFHCEIKSKVASRENIPLFCEVEDSSQLMTVWNN